MKPVNFTSNVSTDDTFNVCLLTYVVTSPSTRYVIIGAVSCVVNGVFCVVGAVVNFLIIWTLSRPSCLTRKITFFMIMVLSMTDLGVATVVHPLFIVNSLAQMLGKPRCIYKFLYQDAAIVFVGMSAMTLFVINIERYLSIIHPIFHRTSLTKKKCLFLAMVLWIIPLLLGVMYLFGLNIKAFVAAINSILCFGTILIYIIIFLKGRRILNERQTRSITSTSVQPSNTVASFRRDLKLAKTCFFIAINCFICYLPLVAVYALWNGQLISLTTMLEMHLWSATLFTINSTLNCAIIFWMNPVLKRECLKIVGSYIHISIYSPPHLQGRLQSDLVVAEGNLPWRQNIYYNWNKGKALTNTTSSFPVWIVLYL